MEKQEKLIEFPLIQEEILAISTEPSKTSQEIIK